MTCGAISALLERSRQKEGGQTYSAAVAALVWPCCLLVKTAGAMPSKSTANIFYHDIGDYSNTRAKA